MGLHHFIHQMIDIPNPTFKLFEDSFINGVDNLDASLLINSTTVTPTYRFKFGDADLTDLDSWIYGDTMTLVGAGSDPEINKGSPLLGSNDDSVLFTSGKSYQAADTSFGQLTTGDFCLELVFFSGSLASTGILCGTRIGTVGYSATVTNAGNFSSSIEGSGVNTVIDPNTWYHAMIFIDRDEASTNSMRQYVNTLQSSGYNSSGKTADQSSGNKFVFNGRADTTPSISLTDGGLAYAAMWEQASWYAGGAQNLTDYQAVATERFHKLIGIYPQKSEGTSIATTVTRATTAYLDKLESGVRYLYLVGDNWPRICKREDKNSVAISGYLSEAAATTKIPQSEDISTNWNKLDAGDTNSLDIIAAPNKEITADGLIADSTNGNHSRYLTIVLTAVPWVLSCFAKKGDKNFIRLVNANLSQEVWFDLNTGVVGTETNAVGHIEDWGNGWYRCICVFTATAASHSVRICTAETDGVVNFAGDGAAINTYVWGMQIETGNYASSYIPSLIGSDATRNRDELTFKGDDGNITNNLKGSIECKSLVPDYDQLVAQTLIHLSDGGATADRMLVRLESADILGVLTRATAGNNGSIAGTTDPSDDVIHTSRFTWQTDNLKLYVDGVLEGTPDTDAGIPDDLDEIDIGMRINADQTSGLISEVKIFNKDSVKG